MRRILAIARLTFKAAFRYRLVLVLTALLLGAVVLLPMVIKHDGSAQGFIQIVLTYTLGTITTLLGLATLWLACGTLAKDVEECQMQMVVVKPISRWQVWLGKWFGILMLNALLLGLSTGAVYGLLHYRAQSLPPEEQQELRNEILVARGAIKEDPPQYENEVENRLKERMQDPEVAAMGEDFVRQSIREQVKSQWQVAPPNGGYRLWTFDLSGLTDELKDRPLYLRTKFYPPPDMRTSTLPGNEPEFLAAWQAGYPNSTNVWRDRRVMTAETFHEIELPPNLYSDTGELQVMFLNLNNQALLFQYEDGMELLYREGGFTLNYVRGVTIIFCWLALLGALGLAAASFLSFPVASFVALGLLFITLSSGTMTQAIQQGSIVGVNPQTGIADYKRVVDYIALPVFRGLLSLINLVQGYSPIDNLSSGRSISWGQLGMAVVQIVGILGGLLSLVGIVLFTRRELATAQTQQ